jgi:hypothetical protein
MRWNPERADKADQYIKNKGSVVIPIRMWEDLRRLHRDIISMTPVDRLQPLLMMGLHLTHLEFVQLPENADWVLEEEDQIRREICGDVKNGKSNQG